MKAIVTVLLAAAFAAGCITGTGGRRGDGRQGPPHRSARADDAGIKVDVLPGGRLELYRRPVSRERLLARLREEKCDLGARAVILEGGRGADPSDLLALRSFLVANRIPRVMVAMPPEEIAETVPPPARRGSPRPQPQPAPAPRVRGR